jgi:hypothetical protein
MKAAPLLAVACALSLSGMAMAQTEPSSVDVKGVAETPLEDLNVKRSDIPEILLKAEDAVYAPPSPKSCASIRTAVADLDEVLGDDFDIVAVDTPETRKEKKTAQTNGVLKDAAGGVIPFRGWVRRLSGAAQHAEAVQKAISAGRVRRGYLKGLGQSMRCAHPAAPLIQVKAGQASAGS